MLCARGWMHRLLKGSESRYNTALQVLTLADCRVGNRGASALAESLKPLPEASAPPSDGHGAAGMLVGPLRHSNALRTLDLRLNAIGAAGASLSGED